jgi:hypothetical protein
VILVLISTVGLYWLIKKNLEQNKKAKQLGV